MSKRYLILLLIILSCNDKKPKIVVVARYASGYIWAEKEYLNENDTSSYNVRVFTEMGKLYQTAEATNGYYVNKKITYYPNNNKIYQVDSL